jgi:uncharacterized protein YbcI
MVAPGLSPTEGAAVVDTAGTTDLKTQSIAISNGIGAMHREHYGRGADRIRTLIHKDVVMTRLEDCFTTVEKKMIAEGAFVQVRETRTMFQDWMRPRFTEIVQDATGRKVGAFFSQVCHDPDIAVELFLLESAGPSADGAPPVTASQQTR